MRKETGSDKPSAEQVIKDIRRATRRHFSAEEKIRIVLEVRRPPFGPVFERRVLQ
jgi:transposase